MTTISLPAFTPDQPAARVDASLRQALGACDRARECAVLWFAEVQRRGLHRTLGFASLEIYAAEGLGFSPNRTWQFKRLADDLERLPVLKEAVASGELGWTKAQQVARVATPETQAAWVAKATTTGRRELEQEVRQLRRRKWRRRRATRGCARPAAPTGPPSRRKRVPPCWPAIAIAARLRAVDRPASWRCITSRHARTAGRTGRRTWSRSAAAATVSHTKAPARLRRRKSESQHESSPAGNPARQWACPSTGTSP